MIYLNFSFLCSCCNDCCKSEQNNNVVIQGAEQDRVQAIVIPPPMPTPPPAPSLPRSFSPSVVLISISAQARPSSSPPAPFHAPPSPVGSSVNGWSHEPSMVRDDLASDPHPEYSQYISQKMDNVQFPPSSIPPGLRKVVARVATIHPRQAAVTTTNEQKSDKPSPILSIFEK